MTTLERLHQKLCVTPTRQTVNRYAEPESRIDQYQNRLQTPRSKSVEIESELKLRKQVETESGRLTKAKLELREANLTTAEREERDAHRYRMQLWASRYCREAGPHWREEGKIELTIRSYEPTPGQKSKLAKPLIVIFKELNEYYFRYCPI